MGRRKFRLGRHPKNYERKRQAAKINHMGRPSRRRRRQMDTPDITTESPTPIQPTTIETLRHSLILPGPQWSEQASEDTSAIQICKIQSFSTSSSSSSTSTSTPFQLPVVTHSITVYEDRTWIAFVHGHQIDHRKSTPLSSIPNVLDEKSLENLLSKMNECTVCPGHPDNRFVEMALSKRGKLMSKDGKKVVGFVDKYAPVCLNGDTYDSTVRNSECEIIVNSGKCEKCVSYRDTLRKAYHRWLKNKQRSPGRHTSTTSTTNFRYLNTPEKQQRYKKLKDRSRTAERRLSDEIAKQMQDKGVILEPDIHNDIEGIMEEKTDEIRESYPEDSFRRLFWEQQLNALKTKEKRQLRWHPAIIKWCLHLKFKSSGAYHALRSTGVLTLPSERTLRDYTHWVKGGVGFKSDVNEQLIKEANVREEKDKYVVLVFDEMKIREDLVFNKHTSELVGFIDLGDVNNVLTDLERQCTNPDSLENVVATHMMTFMVRGIFSDLEFPYAQFPTYGVTADVLFPIVWDGVRNLEECGFKVIVITCDGASPNRKFVKMHAHKPGEFVYKTPNPYSDDQREIFFMFDVPHLIKTTRNCWSNSFAHSCTRALWNNGKHISWTHLQDLCHKSNNVASGLTMLKKVKKEHLHLNSYSRMRVYLAAQVLSSSVANAFSYYSLDETKETETFVKYFDKFFDCLNVRCVSESVHSRKPDLRPYTSPDDSRLKWLKEDFLTYLDSWEVSVMSREGFTASQKNMMLLSRETREGLRVTVNSFIEVATILLGVPGVTYLLSERFCQDPLESFFGKQRYRGGFGDNPSVQEFLNNTVSLRVQGSAALEPLRGNCSRKRKLSLLIDDTPLPKRKRSQSTNKQH